MLLCSVDPAHEQYGSAQTALARGFMLNADPTSR